ncbi:MAG TPA: nucleoside deaminase [Candidatus Azoamicus sp.]
MKQDEFWMKRALLLAKNGLKKGNIPIGSVIINKNFEIGIGFNFLNYNLQSFSHAEINTLKQGFFYSSNKYLNDSILYITLEPCFLCLSAIFSSRIKRIVFGAYYTDKIKKYIKYNYINKLESTGGLLEKESNDLLQKFFNKINNMHFF